MKAIAACLKVTATLPALALAGLGLGTLDGCDRRSDARDSGAAAVIDEGRRGEAVEPPVAKPSAEDPFTDASADVGLDFVHFNGMSGEFYFSENVGAGAALFDYDNDGDLDVFIVQGAMLGPNKTLNDAKFPPKGPLPPRDRLYRNDLTVNPDGSRSVKLVDITLECGIDEQGYGMGVGAGDYNNDGWIDLYVANFGSNKFYRNNGNGAFTDVTAETGTDDPRWSIVAAFFDYDRDGWLDMFLANYVNFSYATHKECYSPTSERDYCGPRSYDAEPNRLFHNRGDGTFEDVSARSRIVSDYGGALGVACADFNGDHWPDIYVANDERPNDCWINNRDGTFKNVALLAGCAYDGEGKVESSMGVDAGDFDADGDEDIYITNLVSESHTLYVNDGRAMFDDGSAAARLSVPSLPFTGFGAAWFDLNNDGWLDILTVNGSVRSIEALVRKGDPYPLHQKKQLYVNRGDGTFEEISARSGPAFELSEVGRGAAFGDIDNDGDTDVLVANNNGPARLLLNNVGHRRHWLGLRLVGERVNRDMLGARAAIHRPNGPVLWRRARADGSYCSANDPRVLAGLGDSTQISSVQVIWPDGREEEFTGLRINQYTTLRQGSGTAKGVSPAQPR